MPVKNDTVELDPIKESKEDPPTWEEVMKEKKLEKNDAKMNRISEITSDFIEEESKTNEAKRKEPRADETNHVEVPTPIERLIATLNKILNILKAISQWSATASDTLLWLFSLASFVVGCLILTEHFEVTKVVYRHEFQSLGQTLVVLSSVNLVIVCPFGIFGIWRKKRALLKWDVFHILTFHFIFSDTVELDPIKESKEDPPTWEEVMKEKKLEKNDAKMNRISEITSDFIEEESKTNEAKRKEPRADETNHVEVPTPIERLIATLNKILNILKAISQWSATASDTLLWLFSLASFVVGCLILTEHFEVTKVVYRHEFQSLGQTLVVLSSVNLVIVCPFGIFGIWRKKRALLKWHNIMLLLMIIVQLIVLYMCFKYLHKSKKSQENDFREQFNSLYVKCRVDNKKIGSGDCCCVERNAKKEICWEYEPYPGISKDDPYIGYNDRCRSEKMDYFDRLIAVVQRGYSYLLIALAVEALALFCGTLGLLTIQEQYDEIDGIDDSDEDSAPLRSKPEKDKKKISLCKKVLIFFIVKRIFLIIFLGLFTMGMYAFKRIAETKYIDVALPGGGTGTFTLWEIMMSALGFGMLQIQLFTSDDCDSKKRKKRRKQPKGKIRKIYKKARNMICKRFLMVLFTVLFLLSLVLLRLWYKGFVIKVRGMQVNLLELLSSQVNQRILTSETSIEDISNLL